MAFKANIYQVIIASPGDVPRERQMAREIVYEWNSIHSRFQKICLQPVGWEYDSTPEMGDRGQEFINKQLLEDSDLLIGIFWTRIGSPTGNSISGSVEEIEKHVEAGKPAMLYFSNAPVLPDSVDAKQYAKLKKFKKECQDKGLVESFSSPEEFRMKLTRQLAQKINQHDYFEKGEENSGHIERLNEDSEKLLLDELSTVEKLLLKEIALDSTGVVMKVSYKGGFDVQTNRKRLNEDFSPRTRALWDSTFENLLSKNMIETRGDKGNVFGLTLLGYKIADLIEEE